MKLIAKGNEKEQVEKKLNEIDEGINSQDKKKQAYAFGLWNMLNKYLEIDSKIYEKNDADNNIVERIHSKVKDINISIIKDSEECSREYEEGENIGFIFLHTYFPEVRIS